MLRNSPFSARVNGSVESSVSTVWVVAALAVFALLVRLAWLAISGPTEITWDGAEYARAAENLRHGLGYVGLRGAPLFVFPPLYSLLIAATMLVTGSSWAAGVAVSVIAGAAFVLPVFFSTRLLYNERAAIFAGIIAAFIPIGIDLSSIVLSDALFLTLAACGVYAALRLLAFETWRNGALSGIAFALAYLTRPEGMVLCAGIFVAVAASIALGVTTPRRMIYGLIAMAAAFVIVAAPYVDFLSDHAHHLRIEGKSAVNSGIASRMAQGMTYAHAADAIDEAGNVVGPELDQNYYFAGPNVKPASFGETAGLAVKSAARHLIELPRIIVSRPFGFFLVPALALLGLFGGAWTRKRVSNELVFILYGLALYAALASVYHFWIRYADGFIILLAVWGGHGLELVRAWFADRAKPDAKPVVTTPVLGTVLACILLVFAYQMRTSFRENVNDSGSVTERAAGEWLAGHSTAHEMMFGVSDQSVYYAGGDWIMAPWAPDAASALRYIERTKPHYLILDREQGNERPYLLNWLAHGIPDPRAHLLYQKDDAVGALVGIYRWNG
jgi:hypothetical protein